MIRIMVFALCFASSPLLAQEPTIAAASKQQLANELVFCSFYFMKVSNCFGDKEFTRRLSSQDKKEAAKLVVVFKNDYRKASQDAVAISKEDGVPSVDFAGIAVRSIKAMTVEIDGDCANVKQLMERYSPICKRRIHDPESRLKELSQCARDGKENC